MTSSPSPRRTPGKNAPAVPHQGIHPTPRPLDKQDEAKDGTKRMACGLSLIAPSHRSPWPRCPVLPVISIVSVPSHIARRWWHLGEAAIPVGGGGGASHRLIVRPVLVISSGVSKQRSRGTGPAIRIRFNNENIRQASRRASGGISVSLIHPRLAPRVVGRGVGRLAPPHQHIEAVPSPYPVAGGVPYHRSTRTGAQRRQDKEGNRRHGPVITTSKQARRPRPRPAPLLVPSCRRAGRPPPPTQGTAAALMARPRHGKQ